MKDQKIAALGSALKELIAQGGGSKPSFEEVYVRAGVKRSTAYRLFKEEFGLATGDSGATGDRASEDDAVPTDTRSAYRKLTAKLANRIQVLELELAHERSKGKVKSAVVVPLSSLRQQP